jgi:hypothetical protein
VDGQNGPSAENEMLTQQNMNTALPKMEKASWATIKNSQNNLRFWRPNLALVNGGIICSPKT